MKIYPGSALKNFEKVLNINKKLFSNVNSNSFFSPYSIIPLISQVLGLNTPLHGSGDSPYSILSMISQINNANLFREIFELPLSEKRIIIDEIYEMIAPLLLEDVDTYL